MEEKNKKVLGKTKKFPLWILIVILVAIVLRILVPLFVRNQDTYPFFEQIPGEPVMMKPVIYLYPEKEEHVFVKVSPPSGFSVTYPPYQNGWSVTAFPGGRIVNESDGKEYSYLYWEGNPDSSAKYDLTKGFVVKGSDTATFFQKTLADIGLEPKEYNEFIVYWLPQMQKNTFNLIHFATKEEYSERVPMIVEPKPDSLLRVFMVFKPLDNSVKVEEQTFEKFQREGFSVLEWGGSELK